MKKIIVLNIILIAFACKEKLPNNISEQIMKVNQMITIVNKIDSTLMAMDEAYISSLNTDSLRLFSARYSTTMETYYYPQKRKLDEMLVSNAKFSDYPEVVNLNKFYREKDKKRFEDNLNYIENRMNHILGIVKEKPIYGDENNLVKIKF